MKIVTGHHVKKSTLMLLIAIVILISGTLVFWIVAHAEAAPLMKQPADDVSSPAAYRVAQYDASSCLCPFPA